MTALMNTGDIAKMLRVSRRHVTERLTKADGFPKPHIDLSRRTRLWKHSDVMTYLKAGRRLPPRDGAADSGAANQGK